MSITSSSAKIGSEGCSGRGSIAIIKRALFCKVAILSNSVLKADPQTSIAYVMRNILNYNRHF